MQELPFVTRFNLGNGLFFNREGKTENGYPWYNVGVQDWMPSWRWWVTGHDGGCLLMRFNVISCLKMLGSVDHA